jgi:hypothetical protein
MNMPHRSDYARLQFDDTCGTHKYASWRVAMITADADGNIDSERNGIGERQFDLRRSTRTQNPHVRKHSFPRSDNHDRLLRGKVAVLIQPLHRLKLGAGTVKDFDVFLRQMDVTCRDVHDKWVPRHSRRWRYGISHLLLKHGTHNTFNLGASQLNRHSPLLRLY